jgi:hypothetical protein
MLGKYSTTELHPQLKGKGFVVGGGGGGSGG